MSHLYDKLYEGIDLMHEGMLTEAEKIYRSIIEEFPEHIDAYHHLAILLSSQGRKEEAFQLWKKAVDIGMRCFPENFAVGKDLLEWVFLENRPFLRACHGLGLAYFERGEIEKALSIFNNILALNPNDNQGIRTLAVESNFALDRPEEVLRICSKYPDDAMAGILYGRPLALFQLGKKDKAEKAMREAIKYLPLVAEELVKTKHKKPKGMMNGYLTMGGPDEAFDYWKRVGKYWQKTEGAIDFVKMCLEKYHTKCG
jgi:tetratricopeptide (TPR) repeat protein